MYTRVVRDDAAHKMVQTVVESLKISRESLGWSQRTLAGRAGVDPKTVSLIERGIRSPTLFTLSLLAGAMGVPLSRLMKKAETPSETQT